MSVSVPYWKTRAWWETGDPPNYRLGRQQLVERHGDVTSVTWGYRREQARKLDSKEGWGLDWAALTVGRHAQGDIKEPEPLDIEECVQHDSEIARLQSRVTELKTKYEHAMADKHIEDMICERITEHIPLLPKVKAPTFVPRKGGKPEDVVALFSDYHIGEVVSQEETGGLNAYDFDIFSRRLQYHVDSIGGICFGKLTGYDFPVLHVLGLGDMVSGLIHDELVETADGTIMDWLIDGAYLFAQAFRQLAKEFPSVNIEWHFGNHGRLTGKVRYKRRWVNFDYLLGHMIELHLSNQPNITFSNQKSFWSLVEVQNHHILALHGDNIRGWQGIPWYGINRAVGNLSALLAKTHPPFDLVTMAHFHQTGLLERMDCDVLINGSAIGGNEYSYGALFAGSRPRQTMFGVHPERGKTWQYDIDLAPGDAHEPRFAI